MGETSIDINCDMGESFGVFQVGNDEAIMPLITSANIACGFHGGDPRTIERTIGLALDHGVQIGAHPSGYWDVQGFGRRKIDVPVQELSSIVKYQVAAVMGLASSQGGRVIYVKPHGALYHQVLNDLEIAKCFVEAVKSMDSSLKILAAFKGELPQVCREQGVELISEGFADRRYRSDGHLVAREIQGSVIEDPTEAAEQALRLARSESIPTIEGASISVACQSICLHGDHGNSLDVAKAIQRRLAESEIILRGF